MFAPLVDRSRSTKHSPRRQELSRTPSALGPVADGLEREADRAADRALDQSAPASRSPMPIGRAPMPGGAPARAIPHSSSSEPLRAEDRRYFESQFGRDFSPVRIHRDGPANESARALGARAYTHGSDIVFGAGHYSPGSRAGRGLLAHELAHVVQQGGQAGLIQRSPLSDSVKAAWDAEPKIEVLLERLARDDVRTPPGDSDKDVDAELGRLLAGRPDELWIAERVRRGSLGSSTGEFGPKGDKGKWIPRPVEAHFFRGTTDRRALVIAGVHGSERQGIEVAEMLIKELRTQAPAFTTIVVPSLFPDSRARGDALAAKGRKGMAKMRQARESGPTDKSVHTNRNLLPEGIDLAGARAKGGGTAFDALGEAVLPENLLLIELLERFRPERIISIHGTVSPGLAGVSYDRRQLRSDEIAAAMKWAERRANVMPSPFWQDELGAEGQQALLEESFFARIAELSSQADTADRDLSLAAARHIDARMTARGADSLAVRSRRNFFRDAERAAIARAKKAGDTAKAEELTNAANASSNVRRAHPSVAGNVGKDGKIDNTAWEGSMAKGVSLGDYASSRGMAIFTVEPPLNYRSDDPHRLEAMDAAQRRIELESYEEAVRTVLLGR